MSAWRRSAVWFFCGWSVLQLSPGTALSADVVRPRKAETGYVIVTAVEAEVREGPSPSYAVIDVVEQDEVLPKLGRTGRWYYVQIDEDTFGWISGRQIARYPDPRDYDRYYGRGYYDRGYYDNYYYNYYGYYYPWRPYLYWEWHDDDRDWYQDRRRDRGSTRSRDRRRDRDVEIRPFKPVVPPALRRLPVPPVPVPVPRR